MECFGELLNSLVKCRMVKESSRAGVIPQQAAETFGAADRPATGWFQYAWGREKEKVALTLMVSLGMIMFHEFAQRSS
jgi:hypothetical protein